MYFFLLIRYPPPNIPTPNIILPENCKGFLRYKIIPNSYKQESILIHIPIFNSITPPNKTEPVKQATS